MASAAIVVGNPKPLSRTRTVAEEVLRQLGDCLGPGASPLTVDLADHAGSLFDWNSDVLRNLTAEVAGCRLLVAASPTYKATYTGLLKAFLDRLPGGALTGTVALPLLVMGAPRHALAVELHLRPLLIELGSLVPTPGLALLEAEIPDLDRVLADWTDRVAVQVTAALEKRATT